jgi:acetyl esterase/lipase
MLRRIQWIVLLAPLCASVWANGQDVSKPQGPLPLWQGKAPGSLGDAPGDVPSITVYPASGSGPSPVIVVCPGGGYGGLAAHESEPIARWLNTFGVTGVVLKYRLGPRYHHPVELHDAQRAIRTVRARAADWNVDAKRVGILGFSAGGHLAATASTQFDAGEPSVSDPIDRQSSRPDVSVLVYPVITFIDPFTHAGSRRNLLGDNPSQELIDSMSAEKRVTKDTPPTFIFHTADDEAVPVENAILYASALRRNKVPFELHVYEHGRHGVGLARNDPVLKTWPDLCATWLKGKGFGQK